MNRSRLVSRPGGGEGHALHEAERVAEVLEHVPADDEVRPQLGDVAAGDEEGLAELQRAAAGPRAPRAGRSPRSGRPAGPPPAPEGDGPRRDRSPPPTGARRRRARIISRTSRRCSDQPAGPVEHEVGLVRIGNGAVVERGVEHVAAVDAADEVEREPAHGPGLLGARRPRQGGQGLGAAVEERHGDVMTAGRARRLAELDRRARMAVSNVSSRPAAARLKKSSRAFTAAPVLEEGIGALAQARRHVRAQVRRGGQPHGARRVLRGVGHHTVHDIHLPVAPMRDAAAHEVPRPGDDGHTQAERFVGRVPPAEVERIEHDVGRSGEVRGSPRVQPRPGTAAAARAGPAAGRSARARCRPSRPTGPRSGRAGRPRRARGSRRGHRRNPDGA